MEEMIAIRKYCFIRNIIKTSLKSNQMIGPQGLSPFWVRAVDTIHVYKERGLTLIKHYPLALNV